MRGIRWYARVSPSCLEPWQTRLASADVPLVPFCLVLLVRSCLWQYGTACWCWFVLALEFYCNLCVASLFGRLRQVAFALTCSCLDFATAVDVMLPSLTTADSCHPYPHPHHTWLCVLLLDRSIRSILTLHYNHHHHHHHHQIFVILRHEVYPKFIAHVVQRSRETTPRVASATATPRTATAKRSPSPAAAAAETTRSPPAAPTPAKRDGPLSPNALERQLERASWSQSADVAKAVRAEHAKCYY